MFVVQTLNYDSSVLNILSETFTLILSNSSKVVKDPNDVMTTLELGVHTWEMLFIAYRNSFQHPELRYYSQYVHV